MVVSLLGLRVISFLPPVMYTHPTKIIGLFSQPSLLLHIPYSVGASGGFVDFPSNNRHWTQTLGLQSVEDFAEGIRTWNDASCLFFGSRLVSENSLKPVFPIEKVAL